MNRVFTREELDALDLPWKNIHSEEVNQHRWYTTRTAVFECDGKTWEVMYCDPATEMQEGIDAWGEEDTVTATEVHKVPVMVERWVPVE